MGETRNEHKFFVEKHLRIHLEDQGGDGRITLK
jgi:hypothetical protein